MTDTHIIILGTITYYWPYSSNSNGREDNESNWITTSMLHNSIKLNWTLEEIGWHIDEYGNLEEWDGITKMFF